MIYLQGLYVQHQFHKGLKGFRIYHESDNFLEKQYFHKDSETAERWVRAVKEHAQYHEVLSRYERQR